MVAGTAKWVCDLGYEHFCLHRDKEGVLQLNAGQSGTRMSSSRTRLENSTTVSPTQTHQSNGTVEKAVSAVRGLARTYLAVLKDKIPSFHVTTHVPMLPWTIRHPSCVLTRHNVRRDTYDTVREDSWTEIQERDPATG